jgi:hypothetical protein
LVAASYDSITTELSLTFDRPANCSYAIPICVRVDNGAVSGQVRQHRFEVSNVGNTIVMATQFVSFGVADQDRLTIDPVNDLIAQGDGGLFPGVADLLLPFP